MASLAKTVAEDGLDTLSQFTGSACSQNSERTPGTIREKSYDHFTAQKPTRGSRALSPKPSRLELIDCHTLTSLPIPPPPLDADAGSGAASAEHSDQLCIVEDYIEDSSIQKTIQRKQSIAHVKRVLKHRNSNVEGCAAGPVQREGLLVTDTEPGLLTDTVAGLTTIFGSLHLSLSPTDRPVRLCKDLFVLAVDVTLSRSASLAATRSCSGSTTLSSTQTLVEDLPVGSYDFKGVPWAIGSGKPNLPSRPAIDAMSVRLNSPALKHTVAPTVTTTSQTVLLVFDADACQSPSKARVLGQTLERIFGRIRGAEFLKHCDLCEKPLYEMSSRLQERPEERARVENFLCWECNTTYETELHRDPPTFTSDGFEYQLQVNDELRKRYRQQDQNASSSAVSKRAFEDEAEEALGSGQTKKGCFASFNTHRKPFFVPPPPPITYSKGGFSAALIKKLQSLEGTSAGSSQNTEGQLWTTTRRKLRWRWRVRGLLPQLPDRASPFAEGE